FRRSQPRGLLGCTDRPPDAAAHARALRGSTIQGLCYDPALIPRGSVIIRDDPGTALRFFYLDAGMHEKSATRPVAADTSWANSAATLPTRGRDLLSRLPRCGLLARSEAKERIHARSNVVG